ncbi:MAG: hypothetical protein Q7J52_05205 [Falsiroseomonas sp.]|nr:hypothetical protein [Falsiroseomonas sp.]
MLQSVNSSGCEVVQHGVFGVGQTAPRPGVVQPQRAEQMAVTAMEGPRIVEASRRHGFICRRRAQHDFCILDTDADARETAETRQGLVQNDRGDTRIFYQELCLDLRYIHPNVNSALPRTQVNRGGGKSGKLPEA